MEKKFFNEEQAIIVLQKLLVADFQMPLYLKYVSKESSLLQKAVAMATKMKDDIRWGHYPLPGHTDMEEIEEAYEDLLAGKPQLLRVRGQLTSCEVGDGMFEYAINIDAARRAAHGSSDPEDVRHLQLLGSIFQSM